MLKKAAVISGIAIAAAAVSCRKVPVPQDSAAVGIYFTTEVNEITKSLFTPENFHTEGNTIKVFDLFTSGGNSSLYIDGVDAQCTADGQWPLDQVYYWTYGGMHAFMSHTVKDGLSGISVGKEGMTVTGWVNSLDNQFDLMYATSVRDLDVEKTAGRDPHRPVELQFKHLFGAVSVQIRNLYTVSGNDIKVTDCYFTGLQTEGSVTLDFDGNLSEQQTSVVSDDDDTQFRVSGNMSVPQGDAGLNMYSQQKQVGEDGFFLVWPHKTPQLQDVVLHVKYEANGDSYEKEIHVYDAATTFNSWESGHRYSYTLSIQDNTIVFEAEVVEWINDDVILE